MNSKRSEQEYGACDAQEVSGVFATRSVAGVEAMIGHAPAMRAVIDALERIAPRDCTVLVTGESGTGKELVVRELHRMSARASEPLLTVNCGAIAESLIESELFGHAKGAFTGASNAQIGKITAAEGGTLFLDEIGELSLAGQVKLLRVIQQREYTPVGETRSRRCNIRVVAATNRDLEEEVRRGRFREDLYYRLNVIQLHLPPLRERLCDLDDLIDHFFCVCRARTGRTDLAGIDADARTLMNRYSWPGNIRSLENTIERMVLLARGPQITAGDLPARLLAEVGAHVSESRAASIVPEVPAETPTVPLRLAALASVKPPAPFDADRLPTDGLDLRAVVERYETEMIRQALARTGGNKNRAAQLLRLNRTTLVEMVRRKRIA